MGAQGIINLLIMKRLLLRTIVMGVPTLLLCACGSTKLETRNIVYQAVRLANAPNPAKCNTGALIVSYTFNDKGELFAYVQNNTNEVVVIDQTKSFVVNTTGQSTSYYDPTVRSQTITDFNSSTSGVGVNLGAVGGALGIGGSVGSLLGGINVGGSATSGQSVANTQYFADQPLVSIAPKGAGFMSKKFKIVGLVDEGVALPQKGLNVENMEQSPYRFSVCITYSLDGGTSFEKINSELYISSNIVEPLSSGRFINQGLRNIYAKKPDALGEPCFLIYFDSTVNMERIGKDTYVYGGIIDYK